MGWWVGSFPMSLSCHNREKNFFQGQKTKLTIKHIYIPYIWKCFPYTFIFMQIKLFYIFKVLHEDSFWKRVTNELGNNPVRSFTLERTHWLGDFNVSVKRIHYWPSWKEGFGSLHEHSLINVWLIHNTSYDKLQGTLLGEHQTLIYFTLMCSHLDNVVIPSGIVI